MPPPDPRYALHSSGVSGRSLDAFFRLRLMYFDSRLTHLATAHPATQSQARRDRWLTSSAAPPLTTRAVPERSSKNCQRQEYPPICKLSSGYYPPHHLLLEQPFF